MSIIYRAPEGSTPQHIKRLELKAKFFAVCGHTPLQSQWDLIHSRYERFQVHCWPRQHGKSTGLAWELLFLAAEKPNRLIWIVAPTYDLVEPIWDVLEYSCLNKIRFPDFRAEKISRRDLYIVFSNRSRIEGKSAENETALQGRRLDALAVDEAASIQDERIYQQYLRPMLAVSKAPAFFPSTPKGRNWFYYLALKAMDPQEKDYFFGRAELGSSPYISPEEIEEARNTTPDRVFRQEWLAEFVSDHGTVFRNVENVCTLPPENKPYIPDHYYSAGVDLARSEDFSVITVIDKTTAEQVYFERINNVEWEVQLRKFADVCNYYGGCPLLVDCTGLGDPIYARLREMGVKAYPYTLTSSKKQEIIDNLAIAIEREELRLMDIDVQKLELLGYEYTRSETSGKIKMGAPSNMHDDCVIALALAWWQSSKATGRVTVVRKGWRM